MKVLETCRLTQDGGGSGPNAVTEGAEKKCCDGGGGPEWSEEAKFNGVLEEVFTPGSRYRERRPGDLVHKKCEPGL